MFYKTATQEYAIFQIKFSSGKKTTLMMYCHLDYNESLELYKKLSNENPGNKYQIGESRRFEFGQGLN